MGLSIGFECPQCKQTFNRQLTDLSPSRNQKCPACESPVLLTGTGLHDFRQALKDYCRP